MRTALVITIVALAGLALAPTATAAPPDVDPDPQCMQIYREYDFGGVRIVSPNSCTYHVWVLGYQVI